VFAGGLLPFLVLFAETDGLFYLPCFKNHLIPFSGQHYFIDKNGRETHENRFKKILLCKTGNVLFDLLTARLHVRRCGKPRQLPL
jgi:hypothetical protein